MGSMSVSSCILHDLQFVNAGRRCKRRPYGRGILQSWSHDCLIGSHECLLLLPHPVAVSAFINGARFTNHKSPCTPLHRL